MKATPSFCYLPAVTLRPLCFFFKWPRSQKQEVSVDPNPGRVVGVGIGLLAHCLDSPSRGPTGGWSPLPRERWLTPAILTHSPESGRVSQTAGSPVAGAVLGRGVARNARLTQRTPRERPARLPPGPRRPTPTSEPQSRFRFREVLEFFLRPMRTSGAGPSPSMT